MGFIRVETGGSFPERYREFTGITHGHAHAVAQAIEYLAKEVLPEAIERDHRLHDSGDKPIEGFDQPEMRRV